MTENFILVDYENVQPKDIGLIKDGPFKVKIFLGPNQSRIPVSLAVALQSLGDRAEYIILKRPEPTPSISTSLTILVRCLPSHPLRPSTLFQRMPGLIRC